MKPFISYAPLKRWDYKTGEFDNYFFNFSLIFIDVFAWLGKQIFIASLRSKDRADCSNRR